MNCKKCGTPLNGTEVNCPVCGDVIATQNNNSNNQIVQNPGVNVVDNSQQVNQMAQPMNSIAQPMNPMQQPMNSMQGQMNQMQQPMAQPMNPVQPQSEQKKMPTPIDPMVVASVTSNTPMPQQNTTPTPAVNTNAGVNNMVNPQVLQNINETQPVQNTGVQQTNPQETKKKIDLNASIDRKTAIIIISVFIVIGVGIIIFFLLNSGSGNTSQPTNTNEPTNNGTTKENTEDKTKENEVSYHGYTFKIPDGFKKEIKEDQLYIYNYETGYVIMVDYTNNFDGYKNYLATVNPNQIGTMSITNLNREYAFVTYATPEDSTSGAYFATQAKDNITFVGAILKIGGVVPEADTLNDLTTILDEAVIDETETIKGTAQDAGLNGFNIITPPASSIEFKMD